ncbi:MAG: DNA methyltransferase, partial [bacterium]|nr:DNA methyltransferase [bacterium]
SQKLGTVVTAEDLLAYVYALGGTSAFSECLADELAEGAGPVHLPITTDADLFHQAVELGRDLLWHHTWGERFAPTGQPQLPASLAQVVAPVEAMPEQFAFDPDSQTLTVGTGIFGPVTPEVWEFEVSGLKVLRSWLGYRMKTRKGRKSSPLDDIRPTQWTQTDELLRLLAILHHTLQVTSIAAKLLDDILTSPLVPATALPTPIPAQRKPPRH